MAPMPSLCLTVYRCYACGQPRRLRSQRETAAVIRALIGANKARALFDAFGGCTFRIPDQRARHKRNARRLAAIRQAVGIEAAATLSSYFGDEPVSFPRQAGGAL